MTDESGRSVLDALRIAVEAAQDKKAEALEVIDLEGMTAVTSYFVICHGNSNRQVQAIVDEITSRLRAELRLRPAHIEGEGGAEWVLMDYLDFVIHVFTPERRTFYSLEKLWAEAPRVDVSSPPAEPSATARSTRPGP